MPGKKALRIGVIAAVVVLLWLATWKLPVLRLVVQGAEALQRLGIEGAAIACVGIYLLTLLFAPIIPLVLAAGWVYGFWGAPLALIAAVASASTAFSISRALGRTEAAHALLELPRTRAIAELAEQHGVLSVILIRISPILPFTPSNAVLGLTGMRLRDLAAGTAVGMAPGIVLYVWAGSLLPSAQAIERGEGLHGGFVWVLLGLGFAAALVIGVAASRRLRSLERRP